MNQEDRLAAPQPSVALLEERAHRLESRVTARQADVSHGRNLTVADGRPGVAEVSGGSAGPGTLARVGIWRGPGTCHAARLPAVLAARRPDRRGALRDAGEAGVGEAVSGEVVNFHRPAGGDAAGVAQGQQQG